MQLQCIFSKSMSVSVSIAKYLSSAGVVNSCFFMVPLCCRSNKGNVAESAERERERAQVEEAAAGGMISPTGIVGSFLTLLAVFLDHQMPTGDEHSLDRCQESCSYT